MIWRDPREALMPLRDAVKPKQIEVKVKE